MTLFPLGALVLRQVGTWLTPVESLWWDGIISQTRTPQIYVFPKTCIFVTQTLADLVLAQWCSWTDVKQQLMLLIKSTTCSIAIISPLNLLCTLHIPWTNWCEVVLALTLSYDLAISTKSHQSLSDDRRIHLEGTKKDQLVCSFALRQIISSILMTDGSLTIFQKFQWNSSNNLSGLLLCFTIL